ncbi:Arv1-like family-domain-containing protein [Aspergillus crustosus]
MPICIECSFPVSHLYSAYSRADDRSLGKGVRLTQCPHCKRFADKYVEHDFVVIFIDLVLIKPQVYRHLLFNRLEGDEHNFDRSIVRLGVLLLLFDVYLTWARIEKSPFIETTFLSRAPIIVQYLFFLSLNALSTLAHHLTVRLLASFVTPSTPAQSNASPNSLPSETPISDPSTPILPTFPQGQQPSATPTSSSPSKPIPSHNSMQDLPGGLENQRPLHHTSPRDSFCGLPPPLRRASTTPIQSLQPLSRPSQASPTAISTALFVSSCAKVFPILLVIWGPLGSIEGNSHKTATNSSSVAGSIQPNLAQAAEEHRPIISGSPSFSSSVLHGLVRVVPASIPTSYVVDFVDLISSLFTLGATDTHLVLLSNVEALYILLGCGYLRATALAVAGLVARWTVQRVILGAVGVG